MCIFFSQSVLNGTYVHLYFVNKLFQYRMAGEVKYFVYFSPCLSFC